MNPYSLLLVVITFSWLGAHLSRHRGVLAILALAQIIFFVGGLTTQLGSCNVKSVKTNLNQFSLCLNQSQTLY